MKTINIFRILACTAAISLAAACYDDAKIWEEFEDVRGEMSQLQSRIEALEKSVAEDVAALQSMISVGNIASWTYNAETGKGIITMVDGSQIIIDQQIKGYSIITVEKGEDGVYYWAICRDGENLPLTIDNKRVPVTVTPALRISSDNVWMISVDGGKTWVNTGISYYAENTGEGSGDESDDEEIPEVVLFEKAEVDGDYLILTLVGGTEIKVAITGEAIFKAAADALWFSRAGQEKRVTVQMQNVKAYTITEKPEGWKAVFEDDYYLVVTSPSDLQEYPASGTIKVLAVFDNGAQPEILSLALECESYVTLSRANGVVSVKVSENVAEDFTGYALVAWEKSAYSDEAALAWLNENAQTITPMSGSAVYELAELIEGYSLKKEYVVFAAPYLPASQVAQGKMKYELSDLVSIETISMSDTWNLSELKYDSAMLTAVFDFPEFYGGFSERERWEAQSKASMLELLNQEGGEVCTEVMFQGPANTFPYGIEDVSMLPATEYVLWYVPVSSAGTYVLDDFVEYVFVTPDITADASVAAPSFSVYDVKASGFTATVTPAASYYKTYAAVMKSSAFPESDYELVKTLAKAAYSAGSEEFEVSSYSYSPEDEVYLVAVSVSQDGGYGEIVKHKVELAPLVFSDDLGVTVLSDESDAVGNVTISLDFKGEAKTLRYYAANYNYFSTEATEKLMALGQMPGSVDVEIADIDGKIVLEGLDTGASYKLYALVVDAEGRNSYMTVYEFTPQINIDYVLSKDKNYKYGMPEIVGTKTGTTYKASITKPDTCVKYWIFCGDAEYLPGDAYSNSDKLVTMGLELSGETVHTESTNMTFTNVYGFTRIYMVWLDDLGRYHAIYEFNPNK